MTGSLRLIDAHVHLQDAALTADLPAVMERARRAGVTRFVCNATSEKDWGRVMGLAQEYEGVLPCFGLHPWFVGERTGGWLDALERALDATPSAVGEIGLDRWIEPRDERVQEEVFRGQLDVARKRRLPVMVHCLRAWGWLMDVLRSEPPLPAGMLIHAYGGPAELVPALADMGAYFSFAANVFEAKRAKAREAMAAVPLERLLIETDAPWMLPPEEYRGHVVKGADGAVHNEPGNLAGVLRGVTRVLNQGEEELAQALERNARRLFGELLD